MSLLDEYPLGTYVDTHGWNRCGPAVVIGCTGLMIRVRYLDKEERLISPRYVSVREPTPS